MFEWKRLSRGRSRFL